MLLIYISLAWVAGIWLANRTEPDRFAILLLCGAALGFWMVARYANHHRFKWVFGLAIFLGLGMLRMTIALPGENPNHVQRLNDQGQLTLIGVVVAEPTPLDNGLQLLIESETAAGRPAEGKVLARVERESAVQYGDEVLVAGLLLTPPEFDTFSYRDYLARQGVFSVMYNAEVSVLSEGHGSPMMAALIDIRQDARRFITRSLPERQASLLTGMLLGDESGISEDVRDDFARTGAAHIVAISGFNMVILAQAIMQLLHTLMPKSRKIVFVGLAAIAIYTVFVGAGAAVVRAAIMSSMLIIAQSLKREPFVPTSLAFTAFLMSLWEPWVLWDVGFQLSFAAVMGMALFVEPLENRLMPLAQKIIPDQIFKPVWGIFSGAVIVTLAAQITTTPIIVYYFGALSIASLPVNWLIIPVQTPLLVSGALGTLVGLVVPIVGDAILIVTWVCLSWSLGVVEWFAAQSWAQFELSTSGWVVAGFFVALAGYMLYRATRPHWMSERWQQLKKRPLPLAFYGIATVALIAQVMMIQQRPDGDLRVRFLDVGNGNAVLIQTPQGGTILVDGGARPTALLDALGNALPFRDRHIDTLIVTHALPDNIAALPEVVRRYEVGQVLMSGQASNEPAYAALLREIEAHDIPTLDIISGYELTTSDGVRLEFANPLTNPDETGTQSPRGIVIRLVYQDAVFLLTSNLNAGGERQLLAQPHWVQATVLQVPSHGSSRASSWQFIESVRPQVAVLPVDPANLAGLPSPTVINRLSEARLFRTDQNGTVTVRTDGQRLWVETEEN